MLTLRLEGSGVELVGFKLFTRLNSTQVINTTLYLGTEQGWSWIRLREERLPAAGFCQVKQKTIRFLGHLNIGPDLTTATKPTVRDTVNSLQGDTPVTVRWTSLQQYLAWGWHKLPVLTLNIEANTTKRRDFSYNLL